MNYRTPGVYIEEKPTFPPSVAQVQTAIPAFIGYTRMAEERVTDDLLKKPKKIASFLEYSKFFGGTPPLNIDKIVLDLNNSLRSAEITPRYYMYDSLRLFYENGGGDCFILSVGRYGNNITKKAFEDGLIELANHDEPTLILFPDAVYLSDEDLKGVQQAALAQCNDRKDRFAILDLKEADENGKHTWVECKDRFRENIGNLNLKYGAAYTPHLKTNIAKNIVYKDIKDNINRGSVDNQVQLSELTEEQGIRDLITKLDGLCSGREVIDKSFSHHNTAFSVDGSGDWFTLEQPYETLKSKLWNAANADDEKTAFNNILKFLYAIGISLCCLKNKMELKQDTGESFTLGNEDLESIIKKNDYESVLKRLAAIDKSDAAVDRSAYDDSVQLKESTEIKKFLKEKLTIDVEDDEFGANSDAFTVDDEDTPSLTDKLQKALRTTLEVIFKDLDTAVRNLKEEAAGVESNSNTQLYNEFPLYRKLIDSLSSSLSTVPPSGAIAGIYAYVDSNRGVWKAPANVSLGGSVVDLTRHFSRSETDDLNIHTSGKSINAIKTFTGRGRLVWGARTLAGNDNEWKYVSVRRFFNMVEESIKKSMDLMVFEPNDANTWVRARGMIENFLTLQWRNGALQGAKPDEAFRVKIGIGETMTYSDVLEGIMNVEIEMAVVRPAEFIKLIFSHKMLGS